MGKIAVRVPINHGNRIAIFEPVGVVVGKIGLDVIPLVDNAVILQGKTRRRLKIYMIGAEDLLELTL
jgi:hypothetical protein